MPVRETHRNIIRQKRTAILSDKIYMRSKADEVASLIYCTAQKQKIMKN